MMTPYTCSPRLAEKEGIVRSAARKDRREDPPNCQIGRGCPSAANARVAAEPQSGLQVLEAAVKESQQMQDEFRASSICCSLSPKRRVRLAICCR